MQASEVAAMADAENAKAEVPMKVGMRVDILDEEGIWNTGKIVDIDQQEENMVEIKYDGWPDEHNEWVECDSDRLAPLHTFTLVKKCWAKLRKWPWWPAFVVLRAPTTQLARECLEIEKKVYVEFNDAFSEPKRSRCWLMRKDVSSFDDEFDERAGKSLGKNFHKFVEGTQRAQAENSPLLFTGPGSLCIEYSSITPRRLSDHRGKFSPDKWGEMFEILNDRYRELYGYEFMDEPVPSRKPLPAKKGRGRPAKRAKTEETEQEDEHDSGENEDDASVDEPRESKRKTPARRVADAERTKVIQQLVDSALEHTPTSELHDTTPKQDEEETIITADETPSQDQEEAQVVMNEAPSQEQEAAQVVVQKTPSQDQEEARVTVEERPVVTGVAEKFGETGARRNRGKRKSQPMSLTQRRQRKPTQKTGNQTIDYQHWSGGSTEYVDGEPWSVSGWIKHGLRGLLSEDKS